MRPIDLRLERLRRKAPSPHLTLELPRLILGELDGARPSVGKSRAFFIFSDDAVSAKVLGRLGLTPHETALAGECCDRTVSDLAVRAMRCRAEQLIAAGGGKCLDAAKLVRERTGLPLTLIPASAATCSAFSPVAIRYTSGHVFRDAVELERSAETVLLDPDLILDSPARLLAAGMADAAAKYLEARAVFCPSGGDVIETEESAHTQAAFEIAREVFRTVMEQGVPALEDHRHRRRTPAWEGAVWASVVLSGMASYVGGQDLPAAAAHSLADGLTALPEGRRLLHGEAVGLGLLFQEVLLGRRDRRMSGTGTVLLSPFLEQIGLPVDLKAAGLDGLDQEVLGLLWRKTLHKDESIHGLPFKITESDAQEAWESLR